MHIYSVHVFLNQVVYLMLICESGVLSMYMRFRWLVLFKEVLQLTEQVNLFDEMNPTDLKVDDCELQRLFDGLYSTQTFLLHEYIVSLSKYEVLSIAADGHWISVIFYFLSEDFPMEQYTIQRIHIIFVIRKVHRNDTCIFIPKAPSIMF